MKNLGKGDIPTVEEVITSRQNAQIVRLMKLSDKKYRDAERAFRIDGIKLFCEAKRKGLQMDTVFLRSSAREKLSWRAQSLCGVSDAFAGEKVVIVEDGLFDRISEEKSPEGIICAVKYIDKIRKITTIKKESDDCYAGFPESGERLLLLESVRDPSNLGAVVRSAVALGIQRVICSSDCADVYQNRAVRASMGTLFDLNIDMVSPADLPRVIAALRRQGRRVFAAALDSDAVRLGSFDCLPGDCAVIGNEGHGLSAETIAACTRKVYIPMRESVESLNAAVAASLFLWELRRGVCGSAN